MGQSRNPDFTARSFGDRLEDVRFFLSSAEIPTEGWPLSPEVPRHPAERDAGRGFSSE